MKHYCLNIIVSLSLASCAGSFYDIHDTEPAYVVNKMHTPFFKEAGQLQAEASMSETGEFAVGYAPFSNIAIVTSLRLKDPPESDTDYHRNRYFDLGAGYFLEREGALRVEAFARIGFGSHISSDRYNPFDFPAPEDTTTSLGLFAYDYTKYVLQVNSGWEWENWMLGMSFRTGFVELKNISRNIQTVHDNALVTNTVNESKSSPFFDLAYTGRFRVTEGLWLELQMVFGHMYQIVGFTNVRHNDDVDSHGSAALSLFYKF